jgi:hypothetical protein
MQRSDVRRCVLRHSNGEYYDINDCCIARRFGVYGRRGTLQYR